MSLQVTAAGPGATIQDGGRKGLLRFGVTPAGPMDWVAMTTANLALGNPADAAAIEIAGGGLAIACEEEPVTVAFAGGGFLWTRDGERLPPAARVTLAPGATLAARAGSWGAFTYLAVAGGIDVPLVLGSRATHTRSALGGLDGRMLAPGDTLASGQAVTPAGEEAAIEAPWLARAADPIRVVLGPQDDYFEHEALALFLEASFALSPVADRMAYKFTGPRVAHARDFNIVSDGVALGAIQVAGDGQPMVLMADRQPTGGYPKIAHVARVDISRLAQLRPGETCRFRAVAPAEAAAALRALEDAVADTPGLCVPLRRVPTTALLLAVNLIGGVVDGRI
jgi:biotin-dependent carboxylase-like uncharacterized protein